ncbi:MAG: tRNA (guanosine(37)-N1)-methyltransferase TrmD [Rickettsiales bacterium]|jgi:tRNA (guanine37-N1)-methyltransferase|nr:tRNA (guanosine(37)-N1)-methyltransferase TrmD [Rickettsiales bacterium]
MLKVKIFTLFPEFFSIYLKSSILGRALEKKLWYYEIISIRDYGITKYKKVDDIPFGGGSGMILRADVIASAIDDNCDKNTKIYYMSPRGRVFKQENTKEIIENKEISIICGRYEGIDQRVIDYYNIEELSIGDYILTGGEIPAIVIIDACVRAIDGAIEKESFRNESFMDNLLEEPLYTRPLEWREITVPDILRSGHHAKINEWKLKERENITKKRRKDMWKKYNK